MDRDGTAAPALTEPDEAAIREAALAGIAGYATDGLHLTAEEADAWLARLEAGEDVPPPPCHR